MRQSTRSHASIGTSRSGSRRCYGGWTGGIMLVRDARLDDLPQVVDIYNEGILKTTSTWTEKLQTLEESVAWFDALNARTFPTVVAVDEGGGAVIGVATFGDFRDSISKEGYRFTVEHSVHVTEARWGRGVGSALMSRLFEEAARRNVHA